MAVPPRCVVLHMRPERGDARGERVPAVRRRGCRAQHRVVTVDLQPRVQFRVQARVQRGDFLQVAAPRHQPELILGEDHPTLGRQIQIDGR